MSVKISRLKLNSTINLEIIIYNFFVRFLKDVTMVFIPLLICHVQYILQIQNI